MAEEKKTDKRRNVYENVYKAAINITPLQKLKQGETIKLLADDAAPFGDMLKMVRK